MDLSPENNLAVRVRDLTKQYKNGTQATCGIDFSVRRGESVAILGANGAGKTTFLRQLTTELKPTSGAIEIFGFDAIRNSNKAKLLMGVTPQEAGVFETLTVSEHLGFFGKLKGLDKKSAKIEADELLKNLELEPQKNKQVGMLSGGQRRRILIGLAFLGKPPLLILDEPTTGLDPQSRRTVWLLLKQIIESGTTVIFSTHYL
ncbi:MAG: ABC transporter ATP-binding protein, partial [Acidobacteriota bacterium]|nr:ABC transporter ATP-binding protein [Acidobacteriota bacterium]